MLHDGKMCFSYKQLSNIANCMFVACIGTELQIGLVRAPHLIMSFPRP